MAPYHVGLGFPLEAPSKLIFMKPIGGGVKREGEDIRGEETLGIEGGIIAR